MAVLTIQQMMILLHLPSTISLTRIISLLFLGLSLRTCSSFFVPSSSSSSSSCSFHRATDDCKLNRELIGGHVSQQQQPSSRKRLALLCAKTQSAKDRMTERWYTGVEALVEDKCLEIAATILSNRLDSLYNKNATNSSTCTNTRAYELAQGRFQDLAMRSDGSKLLESLFLDNTMLNVTDEVIYGTIYLIQSLCIMGMLVGVKGSPIQEQRRVLHLQNDISINSDLALDQNLQSNPKRNIPTISITQLKYWSDQTPGTQLLAKLRWKRSTQGAMDLLVALGVWDPHEDLALLRSGFPVCFTESQLQAAEVAAYEDSTADVDTLLGIRRDLTHHKVYTIDSESASEVDDGLSIEELPDGRLKYWIHIADADRWAPRNSQVFEIAKSRITTHYLPTGPVPMFPSSLGMGVMSLQTNRKSCALSLGVELDDDGSILVDSIEVSQSNIQVNYRLSYKEVDEMLMEGVGYKEEWQLGAFLRAATKRRALRIRNGSTEGMIPCPIPQSSVSVHPDEREPDGIGITISIDPLQNQGWNQTVLGPSKDSQESMLVTALSDSNVLVTEMMILAGEALGTWKLRLDREPRTFCGRFENSLTLSFRSQRAPDYWAREKESQILQDLRTNQHGYCHAWYARRFLSPVEIGPIPKSHFGLGVDCYVQWTSPIRRFGDLQVHAAVKRYLRRRCIHDLLVTRQEIPAGLTFVDLGCPVPPTSSRDSRSSSLDETAPDEDELEYLDQDIDYRLGKAHVSASRVLSRQSQQYWLFEYLHRQTCNGNYPILTGLILGCVDPERLQYAVYLQEIGYEHRYLSQKGSLQVGEVLRLKEVAALFHR